MSVAARAAGCPRELLKEFRRELQEAACGWYRDKFDRIEVDLSPPEQRLANALDRLEVLEELIRSSQQARETEPKERENGAKGTRGRS